MAITENVEHQIEKNIREILRLIGENPERQGLKDTPKRVAKMYREIFKGYNPANFPNVTVFLNQCDGIAYDEMIVDTGYFYSICEHHLLPFFGEYYFAYIPDKKIIGLSKIARIVDFYSSRLQIQERLTKEIVDKIENLIQPKGVALVMIARHLCKEMRGAKKYGAKMITSEMRGIFRIDSDVRQEFLKLLEIKNL